MSVVGLSAAGLIRAADAVRLPSKIDQGRSDVADKGPQLGFGATTFVTSLSQDSLSQDSLSLAQAVSVSGSAEAELRASGNGSPKSRFTIDWNSAQATVDEAGEEDARERLREEKHVVERLCELLPPTRWLKTKDSVMTERKVGLREYLDLALQARPLPGEEAGVDGFGSGSGSISSIVQQWVCRALQRSAAGSGTIGE